MLDYRNVILFTGEIAVTWNGSATFNVYTSDSVWSDSVREVDMFTRYGVINRDEAHAAAAEWLAEEARDAYAEWLAEEAADEYR